MHRAAEVSDTLEGRYAIERELGRGGMTTDYLAHDVELQRRVLLKVLQPDLSALLGTELFQREMARAARLTHPHILAVHDSGEAAGRPYYVVSYVEGESLRQRLQRETQLPVDETIGIVRGIAEALDHAHRIGVVHLDIKPERILLVRDADQGNAHPLVADFGVGAAVAAAVGGGSSEAGRALWAPAYMSPEQGSDNGSLDGRSDIYSLGCVAYEMLAGTPPFTGPTAQAILARHAADPVPPLRTIRGTVPQAVADAIDCALAKMPADRFAAAGEFAQALEAHHRTVRSPPSRVSRRAGLAGLASVALAAAAVIAAVRVRASSAPPVVPSAARIAVLPLDADAGDTALTRLARDLAVTVGAGLDGVGGVETADRLSVSAATGDRSTLSSAEAAALARRLGALSVLRGTLGREGSNVRVDLALHDTETAAPVAQGVTLTAHPDSLRALTDSIVWALLRQIWRRGEPPTASLTAVTTRSLPALRAFLDGERELEQNRWDEASLAYRSAIEADSTFWLAYLRYTMAQNWREESVEPFLFGSLYHHRDVLPERDRLLVEAWAALDTVPKQLELLQAATRRFPDYWPGWFMLGDRLLHAGVLLGHDWREIHHVFTRAVTLNPRLRPAWLHMWLNAIGKDTVESGRILAQLLQLRRGPDTPDRIHNALVARLSLAAQRANGAVTPGLRALIDTMARHNWERYKDAPEEVGAWAWSPHLNLGYPAAQIEFNRQSVRLWLDGSAAAAQLRGIAWAWAVRGSWDSALSAMHEALMTRSERDPDLPLDDYGLAALGAWVGAVEPAEAVRRRPAAVAAIEQLDDGQHARWMLAWLDGVSAFAGRDRAALERARQDSRTIGHPMGDFLDRSLATYDQAMAGDRAGAGRALAALQWDCLVGACPNGAIMAHIATDRLAAATWLLEAGDTAQAKRLLVWYESLEDEWDSSYNWVTTALAYLMRARIDEAQGDTRAAADHYHQFLRRYDSPMPGQHHLVDEARAGLARVTGHQDPPNE
jgi:serine/threonine-protein kinase